MYLDAIKKVNNVPNVMRDLRIKHGLSVTEVAELLEIKPVSYYKYEEGYNRPSLGTLRDLALLYGISIDYILGSTKYLTPYPKEPQYAMRQNELRDKINRILTTENISTKNKEQIDRVLFIFNMLNKLSQTE